jgi:hypothetical protein
LSWVVDALMRGERIRKSVIDARDPVKSIRRKEHVVKKVGVTLRDNSKSYSSRGSEYNGS